MKSILLWNHAWRRLLRRLVSKRQGQTAVAICLLATYPVCAREAVYFKSGFSLEVDSYSQENQTIVLHTGGGTLEFDANQVERIDSLPEGPTKVVPAQPQPPPEVILSEAAYLQGLDEDFVRSVAKVESGLRQEAISKKGAVGLMQLMPSTAAELRVDPTRARENARGGAMYLRGLLIRYQGNSALALAAYNAGPGAVAKYGGVPPFEETRRYISLVLREYSRRVQARKLAVAVKQELKSPSPQAGTRRIASADGGE